mgnify:CR=1 FL=1
MEHLIETALLTHGLRSITNADLAAQWRCPAARLAWVDRGRLRIGDLSAYLPFRARAKEALIVIIWTRRWRTESAAR